MAFENQVDSSLRLAETCEDPVKAQAEMLMGLVYVARSIDGHLAALVEMANQSRCGHGTPTLLSPCVDCARRDRGHIDAREN